MHIPLKLILATALGVASIAGIYQSPTVDVKAASEVKTPAAKIEAVKLTKPGETALTFAPCECVTTGKCDCGSAAQCPCKDCPVHHPKKAKPRTFADVPQYKAVDGRYYKIEGGKTFVWQPPVKISCGPSGCTWSTGQWIVFVTDQHPVLQSKKPQASSRRTQSTCGPGGCSSGTCSSGGCSSGNCGGGRRFGRRF